MKLHRPIARHDRIGPGLPQDGPGQRLFVPRFEPYRPWSSRWLASPAVIEATTGVPHAIASSSTLEEPSHSEGSATMLALAI